MKTIHYTNRNTLEVFGYDNDDVAKEYNKDFDNLVKMTDEQFIQFRDHRPKGGKWTLDGWVIDEEEANRIHKEMLGTELNRLKQDILFAQLVGDDTSELVKQYNELRK